MINRRGCGGGVFYGKGSLRRSRLSQSWRVNIRRLPLESRLNFHPLTSFQAIQGPVLPDYQELRELRTIS